ncbi:hypothetical protein GIB67_002170 [Kingdonia uniflora]|uniref:Uncharacterized protein n=1 Tax=Kingdonia uniflora TaxID=39325 RepID=A0A7J7KWL6_9MAGN|nr:hypothetical protein GIB67_002170 [Kingdonia uniflora]
MVKTRSQRAVEARALDDLRLAFKIDEKREAVYGQQGYDAVLLETRANYEGITDIERGEEMNCVYWSESMRTCWWSVEDHKKFVLVMAREEIINEDRDIASGLLKACGGKDKRKAISRSLYYKQREEAEIEEVLKKLWELSKLVRTNAVDSHSGVEGDEEDTVAELVEWPRLKGSRFDYGLTLPLSNLAKSVMNMIGACPTQLNCNFWEVILVCETLNERWAASGSERRITAKDFLEYYAMKYVTATDGAFLSPSSSRPCFFDLSSTGRVWNDNLLWVSGECLHRSDEEPLELNNRTITKGISCKVSRKESFIDIVAREGTELEAVLKELEISRFKRVASKDDKVRRSQAKRRMAGKTPGSMEEKLLTPELNTPLKLARLNEMPDGPVDMATVYSTVVRNLAKRMAVKRGAASCSVTSDSVDDCTKRRKFARNLRGVQLGLQDRSIELEKKISQLEGEKKKFEENLTWEREAFQLELENKREVVALKLKEVRAESVAKAEQLVTASTTSRNNLAGKLYQLRYTKAEILEFSKGNYG